MTATEDPTGDSDSIQTLVDNIADLVVTKTGPPDPVLAGSQIVYTVTVLNNGPSTALNVVATDMLPAEVSSATTSGCVEDLNGVPTCTLGNIASGTAVQYTITGTVQAGLMGNISNSVSVASSSQEGNPGNETDTHDNEVVDEADLQVAKTQTSPAGDVRAGETVTYTITVTNNPGFPFWPSWSVYDSRLPAAMQRFSHCCQVRYSFRCRSGLRMLADHGVPAKPEGPLATPLPRRPSATRVRWLFRAVDVTLRAQVAPKSAAACRRTTSGSDAPPQAATNNIARASRAVRPSSSADAASSSATSF